MGAVMRLAVVGLVAVFLGAANGANAHDIVEVEVLIKRVETKFEFRVGGTAGNWIADRFSGRGRTESEATAAAMKACQAKLDRYRKPGITVECVASAINRYQNHRHVD